jgi:hypothetical protein
MRVNQTPAVAPVINDVTRWTDLALRKLFYGLWQAQEQSWIVVCSDETTALTAGTAKVTFRMPWALKLINLRASLTTAQASGSIFTVDVNASGTSVISTKLTIDNTEKTSVTAATSFVFASTDTTLDDDEEITIDIDQIGNSTAKGLKVTFYGVRA